MASGGSIKLEMDGEALAEGCLASFVGVDNELFIGDVGRGATVEDRIGS